LYGGLYLSDAPRPLQFELPSANGAIRHARLLLDGLLIPAGFEEGADEFALLGRIGFALRGRVSIFVGRGS
jgi:hypothetical protein